MTWGKKEKKSVGGAGWGMYGTYRFKEIEETRPPDKQWSFLESH